MNKDDENKFTTIKGRVVQYIEFKRIPKESFFAKIGMTSANFRGNAQNTPLNSTAIENILSECADIDIEWLLTGKGSMLKKNSENISDEKPIPETNPRNQSQNTQNQAQKPSPDMKGTRNWSPEISCEFSEEEISDQQQIDSLNVLVEGLQKELAAKNALIQAKDETIATQINALKLLEGQINASTNLLEQLTVFLSGDSKKRPDSGDARTASDVAASG